MVLVPTFGDNPITDAGHDWLGRTAICAVLTDLLHRESLDLPLTIGVYGDWGSGKTSILQLVRAQLHSQELGIWFNAWAYAQQQDALWRALLLTIIACFRNPAFQDQLLNQRTLEALLADTQLDAPTLRKKLNEQLTRLETSLYRSKVYRQHEGFELNMQTATLLAVRAALRMVPAVGSELAKTLENALAEGQDVKDLFSLLNVREREELREHVQSIEQFKAEFQQLIHRFVTTTGRRLVIFIDDLDRCLPEQAISVLESIKIFFDSIDGSPLNCIFVLGMDRRVVEEGMRIRYGVSGEATVNARSYLDKIIQIPFSIPPLSREQIEHFAARWCATHQPALSHCTALIATGVAANPRSVKRTLNILALLHDLRKVAQQDISPDTLSILTKVVVIQTSYDDVYHQIAQNADLLRHLELASHAAAGTSYAEVTSNILQRYPRLSEMLRLMPRLPSNPERARHLIDDLLYGLLTQSFTTA